MNYETVIHRRLFSRHRQRFRVKALVFSYTTYKFALAKATIYLKMIELNFFEFVFLELVATHNLGVLAETFIIGPFIVFLLIEHLHFDFLVAIAQSRVTESFIFLVRDIL
jgi:hypothetical protein